MRNIVFGNCLLLMLVCVSVAMQGCIPLPPVIPARTEAAHYGVLLRNGAPLTGARIWTHDGPRAPFVFPIEDWRVVHSDESGAFEIPAHKGLVWGLPIGPLDMAGCGGLGIQIEDGTLYRWDYYWMNFLQPEVIMCDLGDSDPALPGCIALWEEGLLDDWAALQGAAGRPPVRVSASLIEALERVRVEDEDLQAAIVRTYETLEKNPVVSAEYYWRLRKAGEPLPGLEGQPARCPGARRGYRDPDPLMSPTETTE